MEQTGVEPKLASVDLHNYGIIVPKPQDVPIQSYRVLLGQLCDSLNFTMNFEWVNQGMNLKLGEYTFLCELGKGLRISIVENVKG